MATEKVQWIYEAKDSLTPELKKMDQQYDELSRTASKTESNITSGFRNSKQSLTDFVEEIPGAGEALRFLQSPAGIAAGAIGAVGIAAGKAVNEAEQLDKQFLQIEQMNLNKPKEQMEGYKQSIIDTSQAIDMMPEKTAKAFFDVQSATGMFGEDVENLVSKVGKFSDATSSNLNDSINAAVKLYRNFDIETQNFDRALESNIKTVQTGITTYDQLAQVQADYAGTAASANQTIDSANKLFSVFTAKSKNVDEAATLTKTAFESLSEQGVVEGLQKFNIQVTDAQGRLLQIEALVRNIVERFDDLSPRQIRKIKEEVGGTEGMTKLLNQAKQNGEDLLNVFQDFNNTDADISKTTEKAKDNLTKIKKGIMVDINAEFTEVGENILPGWVMVLREVKSELSLVSDIVSSTSFTDTLGNLANFLGNSALTPSGQIGKIQQGIASLFTDENGNNQNQNATNEPQGKPDPQTTAMFDSLLGINQKGKQQDDLAQSANKQPNMPESNTDLQSSQDTDAESSEEVITGGKRTKVVRVSIENLVNQLEFTTNNVQEGLENMDEEVKEALVRAVNDAEITLSES